MGRSTLTRNEVDATPRAVAPLDGLFTREEALAGLPGRRAQRLVFEIERRTARLAEQWQTLVALSTAADGLPGPALLPAGLIDDANEAAIQDPFDAARWQWRLPSPPTIREIERHAPDWASLVPNDAWGKAAVAQAMARKHRLSRKAVPRMRAALGLDDEATRTAFRRMYGRPLESIYVPATPKLERLLRLADAPSAQLDRLPPFWMAFLLLFMLPLPQAFLATPIAAADVGAIGGIAVLVIVGALNLLTVGYTAEATARSRPLRYGAAFVGQLGADFLGPIGSAALTLSVSLFFFLGLVTSDIGLGRTMNDVTGAPSWLCSAILLAGCLAMVLKGRQTMTLNAMLVLAAVNVALVVLISLLALTHLSLGNLDDLPLFRESLSASQLDEILGVAMMCFFGHALVPQAARVVLRRDPGGRALIRGSIAGTGGLAVLVAFWTLAVSGVLPPAVLAGDDGTVIGPLGDEIGLGINALGSVLVISALGMTALRCASLLSNLALERLPSGEPREVQLPRLRDRLRIAPRGGADRGAVVGVTYLGLRSGQPCLGVDLQVDGEIHNTDVTPVGRWRLDHLGTHMPRLQTRLPRVWLETVDAARDAIRLRLRSRSSISYLLDRGLRPVDLLTVGGDGGLVLKFLHRHGGATLAEIAAGTGLTETAAQDALSDLAEAGAVATDEARLSRYRVHFGRRHGRDVPAAVWDALDETASTPKVVVSAWAIRDRLAVVAFGPRGRSMLSLVPVLLAFGVSVWLEHGSSLSYAHLLGFTGVMAVSVFGGVIPPLLVLASRRKGEVGIEGGLGRLARPSVAAAVSSLFLFNLAVHGMVLWDGAERIAALALTASLIAGILVMLRRGLLLPRLSVELRADASHADRATFMVVRDGHPVPASVRLRYEAGDQTVEGPSGAVPDFASLRRATFRASAGTADSLRVWAHRTGDAGESEPLPAFVTVRNAGRVRRLDLDLAGGQALVPIIDGEVTAEIALAYPAQ